MHADPENPYQPPSEGSHETPRRVAGWHPMIRAIVAGSATLAGSVMTAILSIVIQGEWHVRQFIEMGVSEERARSMASNPFDFTSDLIAMAIWTIGPVLATALLAILLPQIVRRWWSSLKFIAYTFLAIAIGFIWTICVAVMLGPWFGAFSFPVLYAWVGGAMGGMFAIGMMPIRRSA